MAQNTRRGMTYRRLRQNPWIRELTEEIRVSQKQLIQPAFVVEGISKRETIAGLTGVHRETPESLLKQIEKDLEAGVHKFLLFGVPGKKAEKNFNFDFTASQIAALKKEFGKDIWISVDVCLCSHTSHGHCGILSHEGDHIENGSSVEELARAGLAYAQAGADCVAPSDMMDGRIGAIREKLDQAGLDSTLLMSYSAKFHSKFYGPFRNAADSAPKSSIKDRASYQIDPARPSDALLSSLRDSEEGADILMVKPALAYLDVVRAARDRFDLPIAVYNVSGEYSMIKAAALNGWIDEERAVHEMLVSFARAGANIVITYFAKEYAARSR